jgi:glyceraldehyde 3-phosphate dehydrogenase
LKNIIDVTDEPLVSIDFKQSPLSGIVDSLLTEVVDKNLIKVLVWYDNEWGYSTRLVELAKMTE